MNTKTHIFGLFWMFGLLNNVLYVVILSAAMDIVGSDTPKSVVLLADIVPSLSIKFAAPFFIHKIPYKQRVYGIIFLNMLGMCVIALSHKLFYSMLGIILASFCSGFGEITFLQLTNFHDKVSLNGWSSGTGGAGLFGSFFYMFLTSILKLNINLSLLVFSVMPLGFLLFFKLPNVAKGGNSYTFLQDDSQEPEQHDVTFKDIHYTEIIERLKNLVFPYMLPLTSVYFFEYLINQGVSPTLLFPISGKTVIFHRYRDQYVTYGTLYQLGVFISRSSGQIFRTRKLYVLSFLQGLNLMLTILQSYYYPLHSIYPILLLVFYEGFLGGSSYVNTFLNVTDDFHISSEREFALGAVSIADSFGTMIAAFAGIWLEPSLCKHQVATGRPWCQESSA